MLSAIRTNARRSIATFPHPLTSSDAQRNTIYALSTPPGKGGVAVVRVSGPDALAVWNHLVRPSRPRSSLQPWRMEYCRFVRPLSGSEETLDNGLAVFFKGPKSFTTEDVVELHIHSGRAVIAAILSALSSIPFCRPAEPGEFTRRAFLGGRLDLTQVEGLKDLIDAETESQRQMAVRAAGGTMRATYEELRTGIIKCLAMVEALIDFGEGEDIEEGVYAQATIQARHLLDTICSYLADSRRGELIRSGIKLAIFGPPNAGKSSLLNFLAQREAAIVTPVPGTTRDIIELSLDIGGFPIIIADTAGLRKSKDIVEQIGIQRATKAVQEADIKLCVLSLPDLLKTENNAALPDAVQSLLDPDTFLLLNKADLACSTPVKTEEKDLLDAALTRLRRGRGDRLSQAWVTSLATGGGTQEFMAGLVMALKHRFNVFETDIRAHAPLITRERHRVLLETTCNHLRAFLAMSSDDIVFGAEELRYAARAVGKISGAIDVEEVLDNVFSSFCIGK
ncbi:hypothetical protein AX14_006965 [Amanita brunnescens Koide BX004]|nr:hypothetical protein AX14_006965 [Amanita brunnescens Koide BX004]